MKTNMIKTATLILAVVITTSVNAQNTKSFKENSFTNKIGKLFKENITGLNNELNSLKEAIKFKPDANFNYAGEVSEAFALDLNELESAAKYSPSAYIETIETSNTTEMNDVLAELKETVKFTPATDVATEMDENLKSISVELAAVVRYTPES